MLSLPMPPAGTVLRPSQGGVLSARRKQGRSPKPQALSASPPSTGEVSPVSAALSSGGAQRRLTAVGLGFHFYNRLHAHPLLHSGKMGAPRWPEHRTVTITEHTDKGAITLRTQHSLGKPITPKHRSLFTWGSPTRSQQQARSGGGHSGAGGTPRGPGEAGVCSTVPGCDLGSSPPWALGTVPTSSICLTGPGWWLVIKLHITLF